LGTQVAVEQVQVGWRSSSVRITIFENTSDSTPAPILMTARDIEAELSLPQLIRAERPRRLIVDGAAIYLRLDRDGELLTQFPRSKSTGEMPTIHVRNSEITIAQEGRPEFHLTQIDATIRPTDQQIELTGAAHDPNWGEWSCKGQWNLESNTGTVTLHSAAATVTTDRLRGVPWAPTVVWEQIQPSGVTAAEIRVDRPKPDGDFRTFIRLTPQNVNLQIPSIDWSVQSVNGTVEINDAVIQLQGISAAAAGGQLALKGEFDFKAEPPVVRMDVEGRGIDLKQLPTSWSIPPQIAGQLKGSAHLELVLHDDGIVTRGEGRGEVENATVAGIPAERVEMRLAADGGRFRFQTGDQELAALLFLICLQPPATDKPLTVEVNFEFKDVDIPDLLNRLKVQVPIQFDGKASIKAQARLPVDRPGDLQAYGLVGRLTSARLTLEDILLEDVAADLVLENGILSLKDLTARIPGPPGSGQPGSISGSARAGIEPFTDLEARLTLSNVSPTIVTKSLQLPVDGTSGGLAGEFTFQSPLSTIRDARSWIFGAKLTSINLVIMNRKIDDLDVAVQGKDGTARIERATFKVEQLSLTATGNLALNSPFKYSGVIRADSDRDVSIQRLIPEAKLPVPVEGLLTARGDIRGALSPWTATASGSGGATNLRVASMRISHLDFDWTFDRNQLAIQNARGRMYDGDVTAQVHLPTEDDKALTATIALDSISASSFVRHWPAIPVRPSGRVSGQVQVRYAGDPQQLTANVELNSPQLMISGMPTSQVRAKANYRNDRLDYELTGQPGGGELSLVGSTRFTPTIASTGRLQLKRLDLSRLVAENQNWRGQVNLDFTLRDDAGKSSGDGQISIVGLGSGDTELAERLTADLRLAGSVVSIAGPNGGLAGGDIRGRGRYDLSGRERGFISLNLTSVEANRLLSPFPSLDDQVHAKMDGQIRGSLGRVFSGSGAFSFSRGRIFGLSVTDARLPVDWALSPGNRVDLRFRDLRAQAGTGRITGNVEALISSDTRIEGQLRFLGVDLKSVLKETADFERVAGRADGSFDFKGDRVQDLGDVSGQLQLTFTQTSALETPILKPIAPYVAPGQSFLGFTRGELRAFLFNRVLRIQRLTLEAPSVRIFGEGNVTTSGRLDLSVSAMTGQIGASPQLLRLAGVTLPPLSPIPVATLARISNDLSRRMIRLHIGGTIRVPTVQVNAAALLTESVVRYFLGSMNAAPMSQ
jgi:uncharacterized protein involved in outer membrane biogenesis